MGVYLVTVKAINGEINPPRLIRNIVEDIKILVKAVRNVKFVYSSRSINMLVDMLGKKTHCACTYAMFGLS